MLHDATVDSYVNSLGRSIASRTSRADLDWKFAVVNTDVINAFALPGGFVSLTRDVRAAGRLRLRQSRRARARQQRERARGRARARDRACGPATFGQADGAGAA